MTGSSVLPVAIHKNQLFFLFGKENPQEDSAKGFSDFGGSMEGNDTAYDTAMREGAEELTGFLGNPQELDKHIQSHGGTLQFRLEHYFTHIFYMDFDPNLPKYYNMNHDFLWKNKNIDNKVLNKSKLFEKIEIQWFTPQQMMRRIKEFRGFYQEMVKKLNKEQNQIKQFAVNCKRKKFTRKRQKKNASNLEKKVRFHSSVFSNRKTKKYRKTPLTDE